MKGFKMDSEGPRRVHECEDCEPQLDSPTLKTLTYDQMPDGQYILINQEDEIVARIEGLGPETLKYAAFIERAVNHFQDLLTAARVIKASLDSKKYGDRKEGELEGYFNLCDAIAKAEGATHE